VKRRILVVEDDAAFAEVLQHHFVTRGFQVQTASEGTAAMRAASSYHPDLILLDVSLPGTNGFDLCAKWRANSRVPIIFMTARSLKKDALRGFELGADDYVTKPFDLEMLTARINAVLRRTRQPLDDIDLDDVHIDFVKLTARRGRQAIDLSHREFVLLQYLAERPREVISRDELLREVWGYAQEPFTRSVDMAINRLRKKLERDWHNPRFLHTARGGYLLTRVGDDHPV
jgi:DNA-binding response OmpR family regulator